MRVTSSASSRASVGRMPGSRRASIVFPVPGGPISRRLCEPAAAISSARLARSWPRRSARSGTAPFSMTPSSMGSKAGASMRPRKYSTTSARCRTPHGLDSGESRFGRRLGSAHETTKARATRSLGDGERARDGADASHRAPARRRRRARRAARAAAASSRPGRRARWGGRIPTLPFEAPRERGSP